MVKPLSLVGSAVLGVGALASGIAGAASADAHTSRGCSGRETGSTGRVSDRHGTPDRHAPACDASAAREKSAKGKPEGVDWAAVHTGHLAGGRSLTGLCEEWVAEHHTRWYGDRKLDCKRHPSVVPHHPRAFAAAAPAARSASHHGHTALYRAANRAAQPAATKGNPWSGPYGLTSGGPQSPAAVACPSSTQCTAVDSYGRMTTFNPNSPGHPAPVHLTRGTDGSEALTGVACPSTSQCVAVSNIDVLDIELAIGESTDVRGGSCAIVDVSIGEAQKIVLVAELDSTAQDGHALRDARTIAARRHGLRIDDCVILARGEFPKTPSGKAQRYRCRRLALAELARDLAS